MARQAAKEVVLKIDTTKEAILFLDTIQKQIKIVDIIADYYPGKVTIRFEGAKENLKDAAELSRTIYQNIRGMLYADPQGLYYYNLGFLPKLLGKAVPVKTLVQVLQLKAYKVDRSEESLITNVTFDELTNLIKAIDELMKKMPYEISTKNLRHVLATIALIKNESLPKAISRAKKAKIVEEDEFARMKLIIEPEQALEKCLK
ncbi:MAG: DUF2067 domain-containing protein [Candidatus Heimdallarchaeota archaeon]|nr:DUF2067 domain-containing protein [Candidatus Heimdallarchaeota archaeon]